MVSVPKSFAEMFEPLAEFHQKTLGISRDDVRIYWDIHVLRGENEVFARSRGMSTIPGMLGEKMKAHSPAMMQQECVDKIAQPLIAACQREGEDQNEDELEYLSDSGMTNTPPSQLVGGDRMAALAAQAEDAANKEEDDD